MNKMTKEEMAEYVRSGQMRLERGEATWREVVKHFVSMGRLGILTPENYDSAMGEGGGPGETSGGGFKDEFIELLRPLVLHDPPYTDEEIDAYLDSRPEGTAVWDSRPTVVEGRQPPPPVFGTPEFERYRLRELNRFGDFLGKVKNDQELELAKTLFKQHLMSGVLRSEDIRAFMRTVDLRHLPQEFRDAMLSMGEMLSIQEKYTTDQWRTDGLAGNRDLNDTLAKCNIGADHKRPAGSVYVDHLGNKLTVIPEHEMFRLHKVMMPELWERCYRKIYKNAGKWHDTRYVSMAVASAIGYVTMNAKDGAFEPGREVNARTNRNLTVALERGMIGTEMLRHDMPLFFVEPELAKSVWATDPPEEVDWTQLQLPYPAAAFVLPRGVIKDPRGFDLPFIMYGRVEKGRTYDFGQPRGIAGRLTFDTDMEAMLVSSVTTGIHVDHFRELIAPYRWGDEFEHLHGIRNYYAETGEEVLMDDNDRNFNIRMTNFVMNMLLLMQHKDEAVKVEAQRRVGTHKKRRLDLWTPNVIGRGYRIRRVGGETGTGGTKRWHWRRGHWREQGYGRLLCTRCALRGHGRSIHDKLTKRCKHTECMDVCDGAVYRYEFYDRKRIAPVLVGAKNGQARTGEEGQMAG